MHWFDHFLTKLSKYLWIKTGDRHYHFVEPWVIDRPFCRMETLYRSHFVETGVGSLQNGAPQPPPGNGKEDILPRFWTPNVHFVQKGCVSWHSGGTAPALRENREEREEICRCEGVKI